MGLVFEHEQPVLLLAVHGGGDVDGAGVNFLALVQLGQQAALLQGLGADGGHVHQGAGTLGGLLLAVDLHAGGQVALIGGLDLGVLDVDVIQMGGEGGVAAVVGPVGVHHPDLGDGGVPLLLVPEIGLEELQVVQIHGQTQGGQQLLQGLLVHGGKAAHHGHGGGHVVLPLQGLGLVQGGSAALHGVDEVLLDFLQLLLGQLTHEEVHLGGGDEGAVHAGLQLDALLTGVGALVVLAGQGLHSQDAVLLLGQGEGLVVDHVHLRLGKDHALGGLIDLGVDAVGVVAVQDPHRLQSLDPQLLLKLAAQALGLYIEAGPFLRITAVNTHLHSSTHYSSLFR